MITVTRRSRERRSRARARRRFAGATRRARFCERTFMSVVENRAESRNPTNESNHARSSRGDRALSHGTMLVVAALWVCAFGVMFAFMSREVKGLRQVVRAKVRDFTDVPVPGLRFFFSDVGSSYALSSGRATRRLRRDGIRGAAARGRVATRVRGRVAGALGGETRHLPRRRKETRVLAHFFHQTSESRDARNDAPLVRSSLFTRRRRRQPSPRSWSWPP